MDTRVDQEVDEFKPISRSVEIEVPNDSAIFFYKAGVKAGLEALEQGKKLFAMAGDDASASRIANAINALTAFLDVVREVEADIVKEFQEVHKQPQEIEVAFAPRVEPEEKDNRFTTKS